MYFVFSIPFPSPNQSLGFHVYICCVFASIYSAVKEDDIELLNINMVHLLVVGKLELSLPCIVLPMNSVDPRKIKVSMELNFTQLFLFHWLPPCF